MKGIVKVLEPLLDLISRYDSKQQGKTIIFSAPSITGKIDLRSLKNRKAIYSYWTQINKEYEVFQTKYLDFINAVDKIGGEDEEKVLTPELSSIIKELKLFKDEIGSPNIKNNLNYVTKFGKMQLKGYMNKKTHIKLFIELLKDKKIINFIEDIDYDTDAALEGRLTENQGAKAISTYDKDTGQVTGTTAEIDEIKRTGQNSITATENKELEDVLSKFKTVVEVDPIYYRAFTDRGNSEAFKNTPIFENQLKKLKKLLRIQGAKFDANYNTRISIDRQILEYVKELEAVASVTDSMTEFYLPLSSTTKSDLIIDNEEDDVFNSGMDSEDIKRKSKNISKFLNTFSKIYDESVYIKEIKKLFELSYQLDSKINGFFTSGNNLTLYPYNPFLFIGVCLGSCMGVINDGTYYFDETYEVKEDYELSLRHIVDKGLVVRSNILFMQHEHTQLKGGCRDSRRIEKEKLAVKRLIKEYPNMIKEAKHRGTSFSIQLNI